MIVWILALILLASLAALGYRQGAIRTAFSFVGILLAAVLAAPLGKLFKPLLPHLGIHNPVLIWLVAPLVAFVLIWGLFKVVAYPVHLKVSVFYKYKAGDLRLALWDRLHHRLGLCIGLLNGVAYLVLLSLVFYNLSYWTAQIAPNDEGRVVRAMNALGRGLESTGLDRVARAVDPMPPIYYRLADLAGLLCQNPALNGRLVDYPAFLSLVQRDAFQQLGQDSDFVSAWKQQSSIGQLLDNSQVKTILQDQELTHTVWEAVTTNLNDLMVYLKTGKSPKFAPDKFLGRWDFNVGATVAAILTARPNIAPRELAQARAWMTSAYADTLLIVAPDHQAFLKRLPHLKIQKGQPPTTEHLDYKGTWTEQGANYELSLTGTNGGGKPLSMKATMDDGRLTVTSGTDTFVFRHEL